MRWDDPTSTLPGGGATGALLRATEWAATPLGGAATWPQSLRTALSLVLDAPGVAALAWGERQCLLYNDGFAAALGDEHPRAFGRSLPDLPGAVAKELAGLAAEALRSGEAAAAEEVAMPGPGRHEAGPWRVTASPVRGEMGVAGVLLLVTQGARPAPPPRAPDWNRTRLETALRVARLGTFDWQPATGAIAVDGRGREMFGLPAEGALTQVDTFGRIAPDDVGRVRREADALMDISHPSDPGSLGRLIDLDYDVVHADGTRRSIISSGTILVDEDGTRRMVGAFNDVTELKRAEAADRLRFGLADLGDRLRAIDDLAAMQVAAAAAIGTALDAARVGYGSLAPDGDTFVVPSDWTKPGFPSLAGSYRIDDYGSYAAELRAGSTVIIEDVRRDPRTAAEPEPLIAASVGSLINHPVVERGRTVAILYVNDAGVRSWHEAEVAFVRDAADRLRQATERRRAELALRDLNARLESEIEARTAERDRMWDTSPDLMVVASLQGEYLRVNPAWGRVLGYRADELVGLSATSLVHPDDLDATLGALASATAHVLPSFENRFRHADGGYRWIQWTAAPGPAEFFASGRDVTEARTAQERLLKTEEQLRQSQKMEAIGQLTGGVAHDFNNLLTVIRSSTDLLKRPNLAEERRARYVEAISDTVDRATRLTGQLLAFARRQALRPEVFAVDDSVRGLAEMMGTLTGSRIQITTELPDAACHVDADASQFDTALINLVVNARDALNGEGRIVVRVAAAEAIPATRAHPAVEGPFVAVSLADTGTGIAPEVLERIFEPFFTTKGVGKGTGLGLSQVFGFAKQSGGDVTVTSALGEGTTFTFYLPRVDAPAEVKVPDGTGPLADGHGTRVLVVEDNVDVSAFTVQSLSDLGYAPVLAADGTAALAELARDAGRDEAERFDVVFSDVMMPGMSGIELGQEVRRLYQGLPVVLTSGYSHVLAQDGTHGFELLHKPYSVEQLSKMLARAAMWRRRARRLAR